MGRDYVTIREEKHDGKLFMVETSVGRILLKSAPARVVVHDGSYVIQGAAWGPRPIASVEVRIDNGVWAKAKLEDGKSEYAWRPWSLDWSPTPGDRSIASRAIDTAGNVQPAKDDPGQCARQDGMQTGRYRREYRPERIAQKAEAPRSGCRSAHVASVLPLAPAMLAQLGRTGQRRHCHPDRSHQPSLRH
jgi:hypothetical protein